MKSRNSLQHILSIEADKGLKRGRKQVKGLERKIPLRNFIKDKMHAIIYCKKRI